MNIRNLSVPNKITFFTLLTIFCFPLNGWGQSGAEGEIIYQEGRISEALLASTNPDKRTIGVFLMVAKQNELSPQEWASTVGKYFKAYGFPVKIFLDNNPPDGKGAVARIYVGAKAFNGGNLSSGDIGLYHLLTEHTKVFSDLLEMYKEANPDLFTIEN